VGFAVTWCGLSFGLSETVSRLLGMTPAFLGFGAVLVSIMYLGGRHLYWKLAGVITVWLIAGALLLRVFLWLLKALST